MTTDITREKSSRRVFSLRRIVQTAAAVAVAATAMSLLSPSTSAHAAAKPAAKVKAATVATPAPLGSRVALGAYVDGMDSNPSLLNNFDASVGRSTQIASVFRGYGEIFPSAADVALTNGGQRSLLVAWYLDVDRYTGYTSGAHDAYLNQEAAAVRAYSGTVYIRPWAEMNGDWTDFQPTASGSAPDGGTPAQFIAAWRHVVDLFKADGATNVRWVFNPTTDTYAETTNVATIWPGASYVDVLGMDGYNWGTGGALKWTYFSSLYTTQYNRLTALDATAPVWICEFGSKEPTMSDGAPVDTAHTKAKWYQGMLASTAFPRITAVVAFDANKERDWQVGSNPAALSAFRTGIKTTHATSLGA